MNITYDDDIINMFEVIVYLLNMKIIITEQQAQKILDIYKDLIIGVLGQKDIVVKNIEITPTFFPENGVNVKVKLEDNTKKELARKLIKGILGGLGSFGEKKQLSLA